MLLNALPAVIVQATLLLGQTILIESALSYLGLGAQPPRRAGATWWSRADSTWPRPGGSRPFPAWRSSLTVLGFNLFGDGLRDALDPALRGSA